MCGINYNKKIQKYIKIHEIDGQENLPHDDTIIFANDAYTRHYILMLIKLNNTISHMKPIQLPKPKKTFKHLFVVNLNKQTNAYHMKKILET